MNRAIVRIFLIYFAVTGFIFSQADKVRPELLIRCDDIGMSHAVNLALEEMIQTNLPFSASVMFTCPWYQEAVKILKDNPQVVIGIHLTLNA
ncbi:MAG: ChbG/HpnK family deacetylase, partial [Candidatus Marinimicrobia bacterium]|nr:ChbG/HpnK family deacetylase [Candidatus Neomarinimicrobiota bacterium]